MVYIYVLQLTNNKYYIGKTNNPDFRIASHFNSNGSSWTKKYKPIKVIKLIPNCDEFDEDRYTKIYMNKYGVENVRGGSYSTIKLKYYQQESLEKELKTVNDKCYNCGKDDHYANECPNIPLVSDINDQTIICYRCGRRGHLVDKCRAKTHIHNESLYKCYNCGRADHWKIFCNQTTDIYGRNIEKSCIYKLLCL